jgi:hypothetical protein
MYRVRLANTRISTDYDGQSILTVNHPKSFQTPEVELNFKVTQWSTVMSANV